MVTLLSELHPPNADLPIEVTLFGMVILVSELRPENAEFPIEVTLLGIMLDLQPKIKVFPSFDNMQLFSLLYVVLFLSTVTLVSELHPENVYSPI